MSLLVIVLGLLLTYLIGAIPFGVLLGRRWGVDIRHSGSGNTGATNAARLLGWRLGVLVFMLDVSKGFLPTLLAGFVLRDGRVFMDMPLWAIYLIWVVVGMSCVAGHMASPFSGVSWWKGRGDFIRGSHGDISGPYVSRSSLFWHFGWFVFWRRELFQLPPWCLLSLFPCLLCLSFIGLTVIW